MIEYKTTMKKVKEKKIKKIICNGCGKKVKEYDVDNDINKIEIDYGYGSTKDGDVYKFDLCDKCLDEIYKKFKIPPTIIESKW